MAVVQVVAAFLAGTIVGTVAGIMAIALVTANDVAPDDDHYRRHDTAAR